MPETAQVAAGEALPEDPISQEVEALIEMHDGNARAAVRAVLVELAITRRAAPHGFSRGWVHARKIGAQ